MITPGKAGGSVGFRCAVLVTGFFGCLLSICYMSLNKLVSPTAITIASNLNKLVSATLGGFIFSNVVTLRETWLSL